GRGLKKYPKANIQLASLNPLQDRRAISLEQLHSEVWPELTEFFDRLRQDVGGDPGCCAERQRPPRFGGQSADARDGSVKLVKVSLGNAQQFLAVAGQRDMPGCPLKQSESELRLQLSYQDA